MSEPSSPVASTTAGRAGADDRVRPAVVTGSDSGIGKASAVALARAGHDVGITYHTDREGAEDTAAQVRAEGRRAEVRVADFTDLPSAAEVLDDLAESLGGVDVLVNNAGVGASSPAVDHDFGEWLDVLSVNLSAPFLLAQRAARRMIDAGRGGRIINITSVHEHVPLEGSAAYCASKGGLGLLTKVMALELAPHGITVNAVAPGEISTPMTGQDDEDPADQERPWIPVGRPGSAWEIANAVVHVADPRSSYLTGTSLVVDGGLLLMAAVANQKLD
jgi:NAD(P)-dependent dehydrogenase (short-subunit alcohol dehydrogenase family)